MQNRTVVSSRCDPWTRDQGRDAAHSQNNNNPIIIQIDSPWAFAASLRGARGKFDAETKVEIGTAVVLRIFSAFQMVLPPAATSLQAMLLLEGISTPGATPDDKHAQIGKMGDENQPWCR